MIATASTGRRLESAVISPLCLAMCGGIVLWTASSFGQEPVPERAESPDRPAVHESENRESTDPEPARGAWLGVLLREDEDKDRGVMITRTYPSGPAARAGLRSGDVLLRIAGEEVASPDDVTEVLQTLEPSARAEVEIIRNDVASKIEVRLGDASVFAQGRHEVRRPQTPGRQPNGVSEESEVRKGEEWMFENIPEQAMMLEQNRRLAEQNQRLERLLIRVLDEVEALREELGAEGVQRGETPVPPHRGDDLPPVPESEAPPRDRGPYT